MHEDRRFERRERMIADHYRRQRKLRMIRDVLYGTALIAWSAYFAVKVFAP